MNGRTRPGVCRAIVIAAREARRSALGSAARCICVVPTRRRRLWMLFVPFRIGRNSQSFVRWACVPAGRCVAARPAGTYAIGDQSSFGLGLPLGLALVSDRRAEGDLVLRSEDTSELQSLRHLVCR